MLYDTSSKTWNLADTSQRNEFNSVKSGLRVEGVASGSSDLTVQYKLSSGAELVLDKVKHTFIAAICGSQPTPTQRSNFSSWFPNLAHCEWSVTGSASSGYNCIAWSVGITDEWWNATGCGAPGGTRSIDWEYGNRDGTLSNAEGDAFYADTGNRRGGLNFVLVTGGDATPANAAVMYYSGYHGARKTGCACGGDKWIVYGSKCGNAERIEHMFDQLDGSSYGSRSRYYGPATRH